jgi:hypothetical protein
VNIDEPNMCRIVKCKSHDTFRNWVRRFVEGISELETEVINWGDRFKDWNGQTQALIAIDGTDVWIHEPSPRSAIWWSHKHNHAALKYEIAQCIQTGDIVSIKGPYPGNFSDRDIFDMGLSLMLMPGELVEADNGYTGRPQIMTPGIGKTSHARKEKSQVRGRLETVNGRLKVFKCMERWKSSNIERHATVAHAVAVIVQLSFQHGEELYKVPYNVIYD